MPICLLAIGGGICRFLSFGSLFSHLLRDRSGSLYHRRGETPPADGQIDHQGLSATFYHSEDQDIAIPARFARQRQEPAEHPSQSLRYDEFPVQFFP